MIPATGYRRTARSGCQVKERESVQEVRWIDLSLSKSHKTYNVREQDIEAEDWMAKVVGFDYIP